MTFRSLQSAVLLLFMLGQTAMGCDGVQLMIFTHDGCQPCRRFWKDFNTDANFRGWINREFCFRWEVSDKYPLPRFRVKGHPDIIGYEGKQWLADKLTAIKRQLPKPQDGEPTQVLPSPLENNRPADHEVVTEQELAEALDKLVDATMARETANRQEIAALITSIDGRLVGHDSDLDQLHSQLLSLNTRQEAVVIAINDLLAFSENTVLQEQASQPPIDSTGSAVSEESSSAVSAPLDSDDGQGPASASNDNRGRSSVIGRVWSAVKTGVPPALTALEWLGFVGTGIAATVATGGTAAAGWMTAVKVASFIGGSLRRKRRRKHHTEDPPAIKSSPSKTLPEDVAQVEQNRERGRQPAAPFPRHLDEASELLELRQSEGRVAILDALRGMFLDDRVQHIRDHGTDAERAAVNQLISDIDQRIDQVAPLST